MMYTLAQRFIMKKMLKNLLATLLVMTAIFAGTVLVQAYEFKWETVTLTGEYTNKAPAEAYAYGVKYDISYTLADDLGRGYYGEIIPVVVKSAGYIQIGITDLQLQKDTYLQLYRDVNCTDRVGSLGYHDAGSTEKEFEYVEVDKAGTYYIRIESYAGTYEPQPFTNSFIMTASFYSNKDKTLKDNKTIYYYNEDYSKYMYFKYTAPKSGKLFVDLTNNTSGYITLLNSKKKVVSEDGYSNSTGSKAFFGVKKGKTYYIRVKASAYDELIGVLAKTTDVKEKSGSSRKKAVTLKAKKNASGTILAEENKSDWYKIKNNKKKKLTITVEAYTTGNYILTVYNSKGKKIGYSATIYSGKRSYTLTYGSSYGKANKGTYYIKLTRKDKKSNGSYKIKWK